MESVPLGQTLSWIFSLISNGIFLFVFIPTLYLNYCNKKSDAISFSLVFCLILGDLFSMIAAISKNVNHVIIYSAIYHILLDLIVIIQIIYYRYKNISDNSDDESIYLLENNVIQSKYKSKYCYLSNLEYIFVVSSSVLYVTSIILLYNKIDIADLLAWVSTSIFIVARIPQIILNYTRMSTNGLSFMSFIIINIANLFFFLSILIILIDIPEKKHIDYLMYSIQWIIGSTSTTFFDIIIFYQFIVYD